MAQITLRPFLSSLQAGHHIGLTTFRTSNADWEGSTYSPVIVCQRTCTKQASNRSRAILARARYCKLRLALLCFTTFISGSLYVNHPTQPSASSGCNSRNHTKPLAGLDIPRKVATLSERLAPHRYQWRTAPRLRGAEPSVLSISDAARNSKTITYAAYAAFAIFPVFWVKCYLNARQLNPSGNNARLVSHAWEARALPLSYTRM